MSSGDILNRHFITTAKVEHHIKALNLEGFAPHCGNNPCRNGMDDRTLADMLGQKTLAMAQYYSNRANRTRKLTPVIKGFDAEVHRRCTKIGKPTRK